MSKAVGAEGDDGSDGEAEEAGGAAVVQVGLTDGRGDDDLAAVQGARGDIENEAVLERLEGVGVSGGGGGGGFSGGSGAEDGDAAGVLPECEVGIANGEILQAVGESGGVGEEGVLTIEELPVAGSGGGVGALGGIHGGIAGGGDANGGVVGVEEGEDLIDAGLFVDDGGGGISLDEGEAPAGAGEGIELLDEAGGAVSADVGDGRGSDDVREITAIEGVDELLTDDRIDAPAPDVDPGALRENRARGE